MVPAPKSQDLVAPAAPGETKEYVIAKGDTLGSIARKNGLSLKALMEVNPSVEARKLQIGQKVQIPAASAAVAASSTAGTTPGATAEAASSDGAVYVVKSGDMLLKIAKAHGTSVKKIMAMNDLKTTSIRAGQKLKLPSPKASSPEPLAAPASASGDKPGEGFRRRARRGCAGGGELRSAAIASARQNPLAWRSVMSTPK